MTIHEFIIFIEQNYRSQRNLTPAARPPEQVNLPSHLYNDLRSAINVSGWGSFMYMGMKIEEDLGLNKNEVEVIYEVKTNDYQDFDYGMFEHTPYAVAKVSISRPPVFGSAKLSGPPTVSPNQYPYNLNIPPYYTPPPMVFFDEYVERVFDDTHVAPKGCQHSWKTYVGFHLEKFDYCTICDTKRECK